MYEHSKETRWKIVNYLSKLNYSIPSNRKMFQKNIEFLSNKYEKVNELLIENIITNRNNLLTLSGWLIAYISIVHTKIESNSSIYLNITLISFLITIFGAIFNAIIITHFDIGMIKRKLDVIGQYNKQLGIFHWKVGSLDFWKNEKKSYEEANAKFKNEVKSTWFEKTIMFIWSIFSIIYIVWLLVWVISLIIYYLTILKIFK